jgi:hypothetical protein
MHARCNASWARFAADLIWPLPPCTSYSFLLVAGLTRYSCLIGGKWRERARSRTKATVGDSALEFGACCRQALLTTDTWVRFNFL